MLCDRSYLLRARPGLTVCALATCLTLVGCGTDGTEGETVADESETVADSESDTDTDSDTEAPIDGPPALGISITEVEANQGTAILIGANGEWVGAEQRNAFVIRNRDTLVRLQHSVDDNWVPRELTGILHLIDGNGEELEPRSRTIFVEGDSDPKKLNSQFYFSIVAEEALPGLSYWVELREAEDTDISSLAEGINVTPPDFALIGYEQTPLEMKVMLVPIDYTAVDPPTLVVPTEADLQQVEDDLLQTNPLQSVTLEVHEPYLYDNLLTNLGSLLGPMSALRNNEQAAPNVYYHALVDVRGPAVNMVAGIAQLTGDDKSSASSRVAATVWFKQNEETPPAGSSGTLVHEVGHNQGLSHVYCPNAATEAAGPDPNYPHEGGKIGVYGFGIRNFRLYTPTAAHDYMTYCGNAWVSDWTWNKTYQRIKTLTSWDYEGASQPELPRVPLLVGTVFPDGSEDWWVMMGPAPAAERLGTEQRIELRADGELIEEAHAVVEMLSDGASLMITAPLRSDFDSVDSIARVDWRGDARPIELNEIF